MTPAMSSIAQLEPLGEVRQFVTVAHRASSLRGLCGDALAASVVFGSRVVMAAVLPRRARRRRPIAPDSGSRPGPEKTFAAACAAWLREPGVVIAAGPTGPS